MPTKNAPRVDLTNCDREPIHLLGKVQKFGFLVGVDSNWIISHISENAGDFLEGVGTELLGQHIESIAPYDTLHTIRNRLQHVAADGGGELIAGMPLGPNSKLFDITVHMSGDTVVIEAEPPDSEGGNPGYLSTVRTAIERISSLDSSTDLLRQVTRFSKALTGFDRVMLYKFLPDDSGEVVAEAARPGLDPFLGLRYPASDLPKQARALYVRNPIRVIVDASDMGAPISARDQSAATMDLSHSILRSVSEIHLEYLRNMGVAASMSISIIVDGKLWGLIACHHYAPHLLSATKRNAILLFGQMLSLVLQNKLTAEARQHDEAVINLTTRISQQVASGVPVETLLRRAAENFAPLLRADGIAIVIDGHVEKNGTTPTSEECRIISRTLNEQDSQEVFATSELTQAMPELKGVTEPAAGVLSIPISRSPRDFILFFRKELVQKVNWAGNPEKPVSYGPNGARLTPRKSFETWQQTVAGQSEQWLPAEVRAASQLRVTLLEIVLRLTDEVARERASATERQELLIAELNHRVKNILGLVRGLVSQSNSRDISTTDFVKILDSRIHALARAHDQITRENWMPASLVKLVRVEAESYLQGKMSRVKIDGDDVMLLPAAFSAMALVMHEMITNSAKHGALSDQRGLVTINLSTDSEGSLVVEWVERGGPPVKPPSRRGFGSTIIERSIPFELNGTSSIEYPVGGVHAEFVIPARYVSANAVEIFETEPLAETEEIPEVKGPRNVMVVEDNLIIAMEAEELFGQLGAKQVSIFARAGDAIKHLDEEKCDFALLDINLGEESSVPIAEKMDELGIPFVFASGYGEKANLPKNLAHHKCLSKPYDLDLIRQAIASLDQSAPKDA